MSVLDVKPELVQFLRSGKLSRRPVTGFLLGLCAHCPSIAEIRFRSYSVSPNLSRRLELGKALASTRLASAERAARDDGISLWDSLASRVIRRGESLPRQVFVEALAHQHSEFEKTFVLTRQEILNGGIDSIQDRLGRNDGLAVCSQVRVLAGYSAHIPMLDFACAPTKANQGAISSMLGVIGQAGVIVNSGNSFHFLGISLLTADEWIRFMGQALLLAPFIDARFMAHRLFDGECRLRVFARNKVPQVPVIEKCVY